ncbi:acid-sensing ion channel 1C-like [Montipora foliosa]|uniref:acid-sensing ion channel 1C-like n=1 Tax=Montipora foliosa TaxID=591990 RepID=UPI0035F177F0
MSKGNDICDDFSRIPGARDFPVSKGNTSLKRSILLPGQQTISHQQEATTDHKERELSSFREVLSTFADSTSAHGVGNIAAASSLPRRLVWFVITVGLYVMLIWMCISLVMRYLEKPVVSRMEMSFEESLEFPAVTICNLNMLRRSQLKRKEMIERIIQQVNRRRQAEENSQEEMKTGNMTSTTSVSFKNNLEVLKDVKRKSLLSTAKTPEEREMLLSVGMDTVSLESNLLHMMMKNITEDKLTSLGHDLTEMLKYCRWSYYSCHKGSLKYLWRHFWHWKYGNCYVFNSGLTENGTKVPIMTANRAGPYYGLEMDIFVNQRDYTSLTDEAGIRVVLSDEARMPFPFDEGFSVPTGFATSVGIKKRHIKRVDPYMNDSCLDETKQGHKAYGNIYSEKYHVNYSCQACRMSCLALKEVQMCNCSEPKFPINSSACFSLEQHSCITDVYVKFKARRLDCISKCPQPCFENVFSFTVSSARWSKAFSRRIQKKYRLGKSFGNAAIISENFVRLQIFYEDLSLAKTINEEAYKVENLLADIGGQLGLWIGVSVITVVEVVEFLTSFLTYLWIKRQREIKPIK